MGMFDYYHPCLICPLCGTPIGGIQSKHGIRLLKHFHQGDTAEFYDSYREQYNRTSFRLFGEYHCENTSDYSILHRFRIDCTVENGIWTRSCFLQIHSNYRESGTFLLYTIDLPGNWKLWACSPDEIAIAPPDCVDILHRIPPKVVEVGWTETLIAARINPVAYVPQYISPEPWQEEGILLVSRKYPKVQEEEQFWMIRIEDGRLWGPCNLERFQSLFEEDLDKITLKPPEAFLAQDTGKLAR